MISFLFCAILLINYEAFGHIFSTTVEINDGIIQGQVNQSRHGRNYYSFTGIPFGKPPVGNLRFANPEPAQPWTGILNATRYAPRCMNRNYLKADDGPVEGSEDCLYLNVYVPKTNNSKKLPVIAVVPWGGFFTGGSDEEYFNPLYMMDHDVILVIFNYRLMILGFLSTLDDNAPGNFALKDQILALQWIQNNIKYFGGSKNDVTIMGQSAGAGSTHLHMISPASNGLFQQVISQSGSGVAVWDSTTPEIMTAVVQAQASLVNCSYAIGNNSELVKCFRNVPAEELMATQSHFKTFYQYPFTEWFAVPEKKTKKNRNPFLTKPPIEYIQAGEFKKVPWLVGVVKDEGLLFSVSTLAREKPRKDFNSSFLSTLDVLLGLSSITSNTSEIEQDIIDFYFNGSEIVDVNNQDFTSGLINALSDRYFFWPVYETISIQLSYGHDSIYFYNFEYEGQQTYANYFSMIGDHYNYTWGVCHCDDLLYQFYAPSIVKEPISEPSDVDLSNKWLNLWINFVNYGKPIYNEKKVLSDIHWKPLVPKDHFLNSEFSTLNVTGNYKTGAKFQMSNGFYEDRMNFWNKTITKYSQKY